MHWIDILVIATLLISGAFAYMRGFVHEVLSIFAWIGAAAATFFGLPVLKHFTYQFIDNVFIADLVTGIVIFIGTLAILSIVTRQLSKGVKESALGALDRALGFLFGLLRGALLVVLVWIGYEWFAQPQPPAAGEPDPYEASRTVPYIRQGADALRNLYSSQYGAPAPADPNADPNAAPQGVQGALEKAITPIIQAPGGNAPNGYGKKERTEMDRLFETSQ